MNELLNKISSYHLFNYLLPGCLFAIAGSALTNRHLGQDNIALGFFLYYFYGLVISRIGSLLVEPLLKRLGFLRFADYLQFVEACKNDPKIETLSESNNMYRTICSLLLVLVALGGYNKLVQRFPQFVRYESGFLLALLLIMFLFSYRKQSAYITKRVKANTSEKPFF